MSSTKHHLTASVEVQGEEWEKEGVTKKHKKGRETQPRHVPKRVPISPPHTNVSASSEGNGSSQNATMATLALLKSTATDANTTTTGLSFLSSLVEHSDNNLEHLITEKGI